MRFLILWCACLVACTKPERAQDPLDYLRVGVDPREEARAIMNDLRAHGFRIGRVIEEPGYVAFDASHGADSTVRVVTSRGPALSIQVPDVRWPERLRVELAAGVRPDFDGDGRRDVVVSIRERERTCLAWAQVDAAGFVSEVFRPRENWGSWPCVIEIDAARPGVLLETSVPDAPSPEARIRIAVVAQGGSWVLDRTPEATARLENEIDLRRRAQQRAEASGDVAAAERLAAEIDWLDQLRKAEEPVLEPAEHGEEAR